MPLAAQCKPSTRGTCSRRSRKLRIVPRAIEKGEEIVVGVNDFQVEEEIELESLKVDPHVEEDQKARLADLRARRDNEKVSELLGQLETAAKGQPH